MPATIIFTFPARTWAIFYLNGKEILNTLFVIDESDCSGAAIAVGHLLAKTNLLAIEVHSGCFGVAVALNYTPSVVLTNRPPAGDVFLRYPNHCPTELRLFWTNGTGYALEYVNALGDPWRELQPPSTNLVVDKAGPARFYRLNKRH